MTGPDETIEALLRKVQRETAPAVVVDLALEAGRSGGCLRVRVVFAAPGREDSRYREVYVDRLPATTPDEVATSMAVARGLAQRLGAAVHPPGEPAPGAPRWLALQGPPPAREWRFRWRTLAWREDG